MRSSWLIALACLCLMFVGCADDDDNTNTNNNAGGAMGQGGAAGNGNGSGSPMIGAPDADPITIDHATVIRDIRANLTQHIDEIDSAATILEESGMLESALGIFSSEDEEAIDITAAEDAGAHGDHEDDGDREHHEEHSDDSSSEEFLEPGGDEDGDGLDIDLSDLRDGLLEIVTDRLMAESTATISEDGKSITYQVSADTLCAQDDEETTLEPGEQPDSFDEEERMREFEDCSQRLSNNPIQIIATSTGERKINLSIIAGQDAEPLKIQIHDDLIAAFISAENVKSIMNLFVNEEDLELPDTMNGLIGFEAKREGEAHFAVRFAILEDILVTSDEAEAIKIELGQSNAPGGITINGPAKTIEGSLNLGTIRAELPWQDIVNMLHNDEGEYRTECFNNAPDVEACRRTQEDCLRSNYEQFSNCNAGCAADPTAPDAQTESCLAECRNTLEGSRASCLSSLEGDVRAVNEEFANCLDTISNEECGETDYGCRADRCRDRTARYYEVCEWNDWCEEIHEPAGEPAEVNGNLKVFLKAVTGTLRFDGNRDAIVLENASLGDETMTVKVEDDQIIGVDVNPENGRAFTLEVSAINEDDMQLQVSPLLNVQVALTIKHVWEAFVDEEDDLPQVLADDVLGIRLDGSDAPTLQIISEDDETDMRMSSGQLTLSSPNMDNDVVIGEGMCMGTIDEDQLSEEERESKHDVFGSLTEAACTVQ